MNPRNSEFKRNYLGNEEIRESNAHKTKIWITSMLPPGLRTCLVSCFNALKLLYVAFQRVERWMECLCCIIFVKRGLYLASNTT